MPAFIGISIIIIYLFLLLIIAHFTSKNSSNKTFFIADRKAPWYLVAFGMIGTSLSGITFMSVPGLVGKENWTYFAVVIGYLLGYLVIANILMPLYYKINLTSIYTYLKTRFGVYSHKTGAAFFQISRLIGSSFRMFIVVYVLQKFIFNAFNIPFFITTLFFIIAILMYSFKGGIKTIVYTDTLQTIFMLLAVVVSFILIAQNINIGISDMYYRVMESDYIKIFNFDINDKKFFLKQILSGAFIAIVMTGLDQDMMQKNLACKNIKEAKKNIFYFSIVLVLVNIMFLMLGTALYIFAKEKGIDIPSNTDELFPLIAIKYIGAFAGIVFIIGVIAASFSSADGTLAALTTSFCVDFLNIEKSKDEKKNIKTRKIVHLSFAALTIIVIMIFKEINDSSVINKLFTIAGYTYGPLLGLFAFGILTKYKLKDKFVPIVAILSPILCFFLAEYSEELLNGYKFGFELLILNGIITFVGLLIIKKNENRE